MKWLFCWTLFLALPVWAAETPVDMAAAASPVDKTAVNLPTRVVTTVFPARETAHVRGRWDGQVGLFNPLRLGLADGIEVEAHPLVFLVAPHATVRVRHLKQGPWTLTGLYSAGVPTGGFRLAAPLGLAGYLAPSCKVAAHNGSDSDCRQPPWLVSLGLGVQASHQTFFASGLDGVATVTLDVATGMPLSGQSQGNLGAWAPVETQFAPDLGLSRLRLRGAWDQALTSWLRARGEAGLTWVEQKPDLGTSPWLASLYVGADVRLSHRLRLTAGAVYWNADQHELAFERDAAGYDHAVRVRTHSLWPTLDLLWRW
jgi:hypothetical protein